MSIEERAFDFFHSLSGYCEECERFVFANTLEEVSPGIHICVDCIQKAKGDEHETNTKRKTIIRD